MSYQIADEPHESSLSAYVVRPSAPLLALMVCGAWLAWPWFAFNAIALGSPTRRREIALCAVAVAGTIVLGVIVLALWDAGLVRGVGLELALLAITTWKLTLAYVVSTLQSRTFEVYEYYGGTVRSSRYVLGGGSFLHELVVDLIDHPLWVIIVTGLLVHGAVT